MHSYTFLYNATPSLLRYDEYRSVFPTIINKRLALDNATFSLLGDFAKPKSLRNDNQTAYIYENQEPGLVFQQYSYYVLKKQ